jgi:hypothetical protein
MRITIQGRKPQPATAYLVTTGVYDDYTVLCGCADKATARDRARKYNHDNPTSDEDNRARVQDIDFYPAAH